MPTMTVERYDLSVSAAETIDETMRQFDTDRGAVWIDLLHLLAHRDRAVFLMSPERVLAHDEVAPGRDAPADVLEVDSNELESVASLAAAGYLAGEPTVLDSDDAHTTYLDAGRVFEVVTVTAPFKVVAVAYRNFDGSHGYGTGLARDWEFTDAFHVPAGSYVIASTGDIATTIRSVGYAEAEPDPYDLLASEDYGATSAQADCDACGGQWTAEGGSWRFRSARSTAHPQWAYNHAENHDNGAIACPSHGCPGRVRFQIS